MPTYTPSKFLHQLAPHILADLQPPQALKQFTSNSDVVGAYIEAGVRKFVRTYLSPIRVSTGAVIDQAQSPGSKIPQLDTIAWIWQGCSESLPVRSGGAGIHRSGLSAESHCPKCFCQN